MKKTIPAGVLLALLSAAFAADEPASQASLVADHETIQPGRPFSLGVLITLEKGWHTYWLNPGDSGMPPALDWQLPEGFAAGPLQYPIPEVLDEPPLQVYGYRGQVLLMREVTPPGDWSATSAVFSVKATWLICSDTCVPQRAELTLTLPVGSGEPAKPSRWRAAFERARREMPVADRTWSFQAAAREGGVTLSIITPAGIMTDAVTRSRFLPAEAGILTARSSAWQRSGAGYALAIKRLFPTARLPDRLRGLLLLPPETGNGKRAIIVDEPIVEDITSQTTKENRK